MAEVEICMECYYFREYSPNGHTHGMFHDPEGFLCVNPKSPWIDNPNIRKTTKACEHAKPHDWLPPNIHRG